MRGGAETRREGGVDTEGGAEYLTRRSGAETRREGLRHGGGGCTLEGGA